MKKYTTNRFGKGIQSDVSLLDVANMFMQDAQNIRISSKETDGLFAANIRGNREEFRLTDGFVPIGATEYGGVLYILSASATSNGLGEIGTFPSPKGTEEGFDRVYKPLQNFTYINPNELISKTCDGDISDVERRDFKTTALNFKCQHQARVVARIDFDKSVNLYWTDNFNPIRSINTGFHSETGLFNERLYSQQQVFQGYINLINESDYIPIVRLQRLESAGILKAGHYFFFVRYTDLSFNSTSFLGMSSPVPIFNEQQINPGGNIGYGLEGQSITNRNAILTISNLDSQSAFIEIGYIYYYSENEFEARLIDKRNLINGNSTITVNITGNDPVIDLTLDELVNYKPSDALFAKDLAQLSNKLYMANTRGRAVDHPDLRKFFCLIEIGEDSNFTKRVEHIEFDTPNVHLYGVDELDVHEKVGYFSGETYVFAAIPVFKGGFVGSAFPMRGYDNYDGTPTNPNDQGIYRFSKAQVTPYFENNVARVKGVVFDTSNAITFFNGSQWLKDNLIGFYFARGERVENILYQGLLVGNYKGDDLFKRAEQDLESQSIAGDFATLIEQVNKEKYMPIIEPSVPYWMVVYIESALSPERPRDPIYRHWADGMYDETSDELSVFSLDYYIDKGIGNAGVPESAYIDKIGIIEQNMWSFNPTAPRWRRPPVDVGANIPREDIAIFNGGSPRRGTYPLEFIQEDLNYTNISDGFTCETHNVDGWDANGINVNGRNFISRIQEGNSNGEGFYYKNYVRASTDADEVVLSLPVATPDYILCSNLPDLPQDTIPQWRNHIVNVCRINPNQLDYSLVYDFKNTLFSAITDFIPIADAANGFVAYDGDCFVARTYLKTQNHHDDEVGEEFLGWIAKFAEFSQYTPVNNGQITYEQNPFGYQLSIVTENKYNPNYRFEKGRNSFYPKDFTFTIEKNSPESNFYNTGYTKMLGPRQFLGLDIFKPISDNQFPTRIRFSQTHIFNSLQDGYLQFAGADAKDFDFEYGPINAILTTGDDLYSFQDDAINLHPINERAVSPSGSIDTPFILGESRELTEFKRSLSIEYGTQHQWSVIVGENGIYGFDWNKSTYWRVSGEGFENLGLLRQAEEWIEDIVNLKKSEWSDITEQLPDNPVCSMGIHAVYDREYKEVNMTFIFGEGLNRTICFSEKVDNFTTKWSFTPIFYAELERDLYSFSNGGFWLHDINDLYNIFYGTLYPSYVEVIVNPDSELAKHFDNLIVSSNNVEFSKIYYETQHQTALQDPFSGEKWNRAIYREFQWKLPIRRADAIKDDYLSLGVVKSRIRGRYLVINLEYFQNKKMWLREIITAYTISKA